MLQGELERKGAKSCMHSVPLISADRLTTPHVCGCDFGKASTAFSEYVNGETRMSNQTHFFAANNNYAVDSALGGSLYLHDGFEMGLRVSARGEQARMISQVYPFGTM
jgi:hypothetical protein